MLSNAYFLAKFRFDTAENEPAKNLQNFANFSNFCGREADVVGLRPRTRQDEVVVLEDAGHLRVVVPRRVPDHHISALVDQTYLVARISDLLLLFYLFFYRATGSDFGQFQFEIPEI